MIVRLSLLALVHIVLVSDALAEHRVALLIGNSAYKDSETANTRPDVGAVAQALKRFGFRCRIVENLENEYAFRDTIEGFAARTPTRSTAVLYYKGRTADGSAFLGVSGRGKYTFEKALQIVSSKGGSSRNLVFIDAPEESRFNADLPEACQLTFGKTGSLLETLKSQDDVISAFAGSGKARSSLPEDSTVSGRGSLVVSPPDRFQTGKQTGDEWINDMGIVFCWCPPGRYIAGSPEDEAGRYLDEEQREVTIAHGFWLSKFELARSQEIAKRRPGNGTIARHKLDPMTLINHDDAKTMVRNLTASEQKAGRLPSDWQYALPSEDQWEYAARAGTTTRFHFGDDLRQLPLHANFGDRSYYKSGDIFSNAAHRTLDDGAVRLQHVGSYEPNPWGLHDMHGNVAEWCINLAIRGGSWVSVPENCRSAYRDSFSSRNEQNFIGYRIVIQKTPPENSGRK